MASLQRPLTPDSPMSNSLQRITHNIDDLTLALANFSRGTSPEPPDLATCCCGKEDCETSKTWLAWKSKMESRLVLSAEVGQALLERHEAFVRRRESSASLAPSVQSTETFSGEEHVDARVAELVRQNAVLEKRLTQALVHSEVLETSNKAALQELQEARSNVARLTAQAARSAGWENRLAIALQDRDDMQQERDSALHRARLAESRISTLKEQCAKLQAQVARLREDLDMQRSHRQQMSDEVLADARLRLEQLQLSKSGHAVKTDDTEVMKVLESLVADNEALKRDSAELHNLLAESREDLRALQEEMEERRAGDSSHLRHRYTNSGQSELTDNPVSPLSSTFHVGTAPSGSVLHSWHRQGNIGRRPVSMERSSRRGFEPLTPETDRRPLSPTDSLIPSETKWTSFARPKYTPSHHSYDDDESHDGNPMTPERPRAQKSIFLLTRSRGVQTDGLAPSPIPHSFGDRTSTTTTSTKSSHDGRSDSSSLTDGQMGALGTLIERVSMLLNRLTQADALTLTNRLKRQRLLGADVSHLSRTTVSSILHEATTLRSHFRAFLEDEKAMMTCTRRDLRSLFKLVRDMFAEMGQMRATLNDVILDPSVAGKVSEMALNPSKAAASQSPGGDASGVQASSSWMAPLSKFLGLPSGASPSENAASRALAPPVRGRTPSRGPSRIVPKREAVLSASAMNVNVEFSGTVAGRSVTSTTTAHPGREDSISILSMQQMLSRPVLEPSNPSRNLMGIFAGAPRPEDSQDPWVVIPKPQRGPMPSLSSAAGAATIGRSATLRRTSSRLSRTVDAMIDADRDRREEEDTLGALLERTSIHRGMSDSSIHSTFLSHGGERDTPAEPADMHAPLPDRSSVLQALSRRMQTFRFGAAPPPPSDSEVTEGRVSRPDTPVGAQDGRATPTGARTRSHSSANSQGQASVVRAVSPTSRGLFPAVNLSSWATAALDSSVDGPTPFSAGSPRDEFLHRWGREPRETDRMI